MPSTAYQALDANGGYRLEEALRIGRKLEAHGYAFFDEPLPFDSYEETGPAPTRWRSPSPGANKRRACATFAG